MPLSVIASQVIEVLVSVARELHPERHPPSCTLATRITDDLGIDSLGRAESLARLEARLDRKIDEPCIFEAETIGDIVLYLESGQRTTRPRSTPSAASVPGDEPGSERPNRGSRLWPENRSTGPKRLSLARLIMLASRHKDSGGRSPFGSLPRRRPSQPPQRMTEAPPSFSFAERGWLELLKGGRSHDWMPMEFWLNIAYSLYVYTLMAILCLPLFTIVIVGLGGTEAHQRWTKWASLVLFKLIGIRVRLNGSEHLQTRKPYVVVANHCSYFDVLVLVSILPPGCAFVAKRELRDTPVIGLFLQRLGHLFVERFNPEKGVEDTQRITESLLDGRNVAVFPEGTFTHIFGLRPFHLGAFKVAAQTGAAVLPIALRGTRRFLLANQGWLRHGLLEASILPPLAPRQSDWNEAIRLRDASRRLILAANGEPDLAAPRRVN